jgi:Undecaprenyl-phosphate glucose phosphotransferase
METQSIEPLTSRDSKPVNTTLIEIFLHISDVFAVLVAGVVAFYFFDSRITESLSSTYINIIGLGVILSSMAIFLCGGYDTDTFFNLGSSYKGMFSGFFLTVSILLVVGFAFKLTGTFSRVWTTSWLTGATILLMTGRFLIWMVALRMRKKGVFDSRVVIVGAGEQGERLCRFIKNSEWLTMNVTAFIDDRADRVPKAIDGIPVVGGRKDLIKLIRKNKVDQVLISLPWSAAERLREVIDDIAETPVKIRLAPDLAIFNFGDRTISSLGGLPVVNLFDRPIQGTRSFLKRAEDLILTGLILIAISPILALIALAIKLDSSGPVFFKQDREGFNNSTFKVWKFRSMYHNMGQNENIKQATKGDSRITKVGGFLRRTSLDELPQLFNVLFGDMSLVGPRPHAPSTEAAGVKFENAVRRYASRHRVKPGITGWAQVNGWRGETDTIEKLEARLHHDLYYIDNWSVGFDIYILLRTGLVFFGQDEAY